MRQVKQIISLVFLTLLLNACSSLNSDFQCPMKPGVSCASLDQVYDKVNRGEIGKSSSSTTHHEETNATQIAPTNYKGDVRFSNREPLRYGESVMRVWVAPYEDTVGNYHQESDIYTVVKPEHWIGFPPKEQDSEG